MAKRGRDEFEGDSKRGGNGKGSGKGGGKAKAGKGGLGSLRRCVFKVLCTDSLAANIIGPQGKTRSDIEETSGTSIWVSKREEFYPASDKSKNCRVLILHADEESQVMAALEMFVPRLIEVADKEREKGNGDPDTPLMGKEDGEYIFRCAIPSLIRGSLIGTKGANIQALREETGAKIFIENEEYEGHQACRIIGPLERITHTLRRMNGLVQEECENPDYPAWAGVQWFDPHAAPRNIKGGKGGKGDKGGDDRGGGGGDHGRGGGGGGDRGRDDRRREERHQEPPRYDGGGRYESNEDLEGNGPVEKMGCLAPKFPGAALDLDHAVSCDLPSACIGALIGKNGENVNFVEKVTGCKITFSEGRDTDYRTMMIAGPLMWSYLAHMMIMKKYHDKEAEKHARENGGGGGGGRGGDSNTVDELQAQLTELRNQLEAAKHQGGRVNRR